MAAMPAGAGREAGRPRADLHADDPRGGVRDAGLRAHRRDPLGGVRRLRQRQPGQPHRRRRAHGDRQRRRRHPRRQGGGLQAAARRGDPPGRAQAGQGAAGRPRPGADGAAWPAATSTTRALREQAPATPSCPASGSTATHPSYTLYTSGTTGKPKGVQRDTGGYAVALAASMKHIFRGNAGETYFSTSDIGWVVGHSYIVYGPLIAGMATIMYEGLPIRPDAGIWWSLVEKYKVTAMFSAPTAVRVLKKQDPALPQEVRPVSPARAVPGRRAAGRADRAVDRRGRWASRSSTTTGRPKPAGRS